MPRGSPTQNRGASKVKPPATSFNSGTIAGRRGVRTASNMKEQIALAKKRTFNSRPEAPLGRRGVRGFAKPADYSGVLKRKWS